MPVAEERVVTVGCLERRVDLRLEVGRVELEASLVDGGMGTYGYWESASVAGAVAEASTDIEVDHSVSNAPLRPPPGQAADSTA